MTQFLIKETATILSLSSFSSERPFFLDVHRFRAGDSGMPEGALLLTIGHVSADGDMISINENAVAK